MNKRFIEIFPKDVVNTYNTLRCLRKSQKEIVYNFLDDDTFNKINYPPEKHRIYWIEFLKRIHIIVLVSCFKNLRWIESIDNNINNYYGFCSSLRCLIESISDTFYTLYKVPLTIASDFHVIKRQINLDSLILTNHTRLEKELLHYLQATKLNKLEKEKYPKYLETKNITEYINSIDDDGSIYNLYSFLCNITHPSYESNSVFLYLYSNTKTVVINDSTRYELTAINKILKEHSSTLKKLFRRYMNILLPTILILNKFDIKSYSFYLIDSDKYLNSIVWEEYKQKIEESELKYKEGIKKGKYN